MAEFEWDKKTQRYRFADGANKGKFASAEAVASLTEKYIAQSEAKIAATADLLLDGHISVTAFEQAVAEQLKKAHINSYILGRGGLSQMGSRDYGLIGSELRKEYQYLRNFSVDILAGNLSPDQIRVRLAMYSSSLHGSRELGRLEGHRSAGYIWEKRSLHSSESCVDCSGFAGQGWVAIGTLPTPGDRCVCRSRCRCTKSFSKDLARPTSSKSWGWVGNALGQSFNIAS
jgi:hypothetical protein